MAEYQRNQFHTPELEAEREVEVATDALRRLLVCPECENPLDASACDTWHAAAHLDPTRHPDIRPLVELACERTLDAFDAALCAHLQFDDLGTLIAAWGVARDEVLGDLSAWEPA